MAKSKKSTSGEAENSQASQSAATGAILILAGEPVVKSPLSHRVKQWLHPFATLSLEDFPGVYRPLPDLVDDRQRQTSVASAKDGSEKDSDSDDMSQAGHEAGVCTFASLKADVEMKLAESKNQSSFDQKATVINLAIQDIGMGYYQWAMFVLCGCGWMADNLWLQSVALVLPSLGTEFGKSETNVRYTTLALFTGLTIGASFWGIASDIIGRRLAFNTTLLLTFVFALGLGVGGNLPVDGALFLEFLPTSHNWLLTLLSAWWPVGTLIASLVAWPLLVNFECAATLPSCSMVAEGVECCSRSSNYGWRYFVIAMSALTFIMFVARSFCFQMFESPKFLLSRGRQAEAVAVVHGIAYKNGKTTWLTEDVLNKIGGVPDTQSSEKLPLKEIIRRSLSKFSAQSFKPLFANRKMAISTVIIWFLWTSIGMGYPLFNAFLPQYLGGGGDVSPNITYRNYAITSIVGVPGSIIAAFAVRIPGFGRKGTMALTTLITGVFLFCFTIKKDPNYQLGFSCMEALFQNVAYGVLYAYTPEVFPSPCRGTASGVSSMLNRIAGLCAPIVAINAGDVNPAAPIYASGALFFAAGIAMIGLPFETNGRQTL
ncbi:Hypothetical protein R9X50_00171900 [Acrodontium crateriforme]|uniref:Major facilitator superfamily (MFS) profile domain-containing protein n=1 Tax=Acrodontium crateriforme TaxID=150365 RepID=A0AAQ3R8F4_9PEZI|nr:Hypothetical protein R9X50_00171900 [Acrodontium crateriforme]